MAREEIRGNVLIQWLCRNFGLFIALFLVAAAFLFWVLAPESILGSVRAFVYQHMITKNLMRMVRHTLLTPQFAIAFSVTLLLQWMIPARPDEKTFSINFVQDAVWFFYEPVLRVFITGSYVVWMKEFYDANLTHLTIDAVQSWPSWSRFLLAFVLSDFLMYFQHVINHKVSWFWAFHRLHHSQRELNFFTDFRYHFFEYLVRSTVLVIPFLILQFDAPTIIVVSFITGWWSRFTHGNIKANLGPFRYVLVTPQSHRVHHAIDPEYQDTNYGSELSIWDHFFGTQVKDYHVYPATGLNDDAVPIERSTQLHQLLFLPLIQMACCFRRHR